MPRNKKSSQGGAGPAPKRARKPRPAPEPSTNGVGPAPPKVIPVIADLPWYTGADLPAQTVRWLWESYLPAGVPTLLYGPAKRGKSTLARALAAAVSKGVGFPGQGEREPQNVLWFAGEEHYRSVVAPRLAAAGADLARIHFPAELRGGGRRPLRILDHMRDIQGAVERTNAALLVFDPARSFIGGTAPPESGESATAVMQALTDLGSLTGAASLAIKHPRKSGRGSADEQVSGSLEWFNAARQILKNTPHPDRPDETVLIVQGASLTAVPPAWRWRLDLSGALPCLQWLGPCDITAERADSGGQPAEEEQATEDATAFLRLHLADEPKPIKDLQRLGSDAGLSIHQLRRARVKLLVTFRQEQVGDTHAVVWCPPEGGWPT
jgi:putative DNA primase/helicase